MKKVVNIIPFFFIFLVFKNWFLAPFVTATDFPYFFQETIKEWPLLVPVWDPTQGNGFGAEQVVYPLNMYLYLVIGIFVNKFGFAWEIISKVFIFGLFLFLSTYGSIYLLR